MFMQLMKYAPDQPRAANGQWTVVTGMLSSEHGYSLLDKKIIDVKPDRSLNNPSEVQRIDKAIDNARFIPYSDVPFFDALNRMQGTPHPEKMTGQEYVTARAAFFKSLPVVPVELDKLVVTQHIINKQRVSEMMEVLPKDGGKPISAVRYKGETYILDGHHRVVAVDKRGDTVINAHLLKLDDKMQRVQKWGMVLKFDPSQPRDAHGRWTNGGGQGIEFVSPNVREGLDMRGAQSAMAGQRHQDVLEAAQEVDRILGMRSVHTSAIGAWADGAEDTLMDRVYGNPSYDALRLSAAMKGMLADQKAVIPFKVDPKGKDSLFKIKVAGSDPITIHDNMLAAGLENHTLVHHGDHTDVYVFDPGTALEQQVKDAGDKHGTEVSQWRGQGEFLGSWDSREEGRTAYQEVINRHLGPDREGQWNGLYRRWREKYAIVKAEGYAQILKWDESRHPRGKTTPQSTPGSFAHGGGGGAASGDLSSDAGIVPHVFVDLTRLPREQAAIAAKQFRATNPHTVDGLYRYAPESNEILLRTLKSINDPKNGIEAILGPIKERGTVEKKIERKGYADASSVTDVVRGTLVVADVTKLEGTLEKMREEMDVMFEGANRTPLGYVDARAMPRFKNGLLGEIQINEPNMVEAKDKGYPELGLRPGHKVFEEYRVLSEAEQNTTRGLQLLLESRAIYDEAINRMPRAWQNYMRRGHYMLYKGENHTGKETIVVDLNDQVTVVKIDWDEEKMQAWKLADGKWEKGDAGAAVFTGAVITDKEFIAKLPPLPG